jgi:hypothetical protein
MSVRIAEDTDEELHARERRVDNALGSNLLDDLETLLQQSQNLNMAVVNTDQHRAELDTLKSEGFFVFCLSVGRRNYYCGCISLTHYTYARWFLIFV